MNRINKQKAHFVTPISPKSFFIKNRAKRSDYLSTPDLCFDYVYRKNHVIRDIVVTDYVRNQYGYWFLTKKGVIMKAFLHLKGFLNVSSGKHSQPSEHKIVALSGEINKYIFALDEIGDVYMKERMTSSAVQFQKVNNLSKIIKIASGKKHCIFLTEDYQVYVLGSNEFGQLGLGALIENIVIPFQIEDIKNIKDIACGPNFTMLLTFEGTVYFFGKTYKSNLLKDIMRYPNKVYIPTELLNIRNIVKISCGKKHFILLNSKHVAKVKINKEKIFEMENIIAIKSFREYPFVFKKDGSIVRCKIPLELDGYKYFGDQVPSLFYLVIFYINGYRKKYNKSINILPKDIKKIVDIVHENPIGKYVKPSIIRKSLMVFKNKTIDRSNSMSSIGEWIKSLFRGKRRN